MSFMCGLCLDGMRYRYTAGCPECGQVYRHRQMMPGDLGLELVEPGVYRLPGVVHELAQPKAEPIQETIRKLLNAYPLGDQGWPLNEMRKAADEIDRLVRALGWIAAQERQPGEQLGNNLIMQARSCMPVNVATEPNEMTGLLVRPIADVERIEGREYLIFDKDVGWQVAAWQKSWDGRGFRLAWVYQSHIGSEWCDPTHGVILPCKALQIDASGSAGS